MCEVKYRGEVKWKSKNLVQKNRKKPDIWSVLKSGKSRRKSQQNEINVKYVTFDEQFDKNVVVNEVRPLSCENTTFCVCIGRFFFKYALKMQR